MRMSTTPTTAASSSEEDSPQTPKASERKSARSVSNRGAKRKANGSSSARGSVSHEPAKDVSEVLGSVRLRSVHARVLSWHVDAHTLVSLRLGSNDGLRKWTRMLTMMRRDEGSRSDPDHRVVVIFDGSSVSMTKDMRVSGFMWFSSNSPSEIMIRDTWVDPQRRRLGIGSRMVRVFAVSMVSSLTGDHNSNSSSSSTSTRASSSGDELAECQPLEFDSKDFKVLALPAPGSTTFWESNLFSGNGQSGGFLQLTWETMVRLAQLDLDLPESPSRKAARTNTPPSEYPSSRAVSKGSGGALRNCKRSRF